MSLGRPLEFDPDTVLRAALDLFWCKGYEPTSLADLLEAMNISKSSMYLAFKSKRELFIKCLMLYQDQLINELSSELEQSSTGFAFFEVVLDMVATGAGEPAGTRGCMLVNSASEFGQDDPEITQGIAQGLWRISALFQKAIEKGQQDKSITTRQDSLSLANYLGVTLIGLRIFIKAGANKNTAKGVAQTILKIFS